MPHLPDDINVFELTALEVAESEEDLIYEYMKRHEFRLALMNSRVRDAMFDAMIEENGIEGGWFWSRSDFPHGPFDTSIGARCDALALCGDCAG